jgi:CRISPR-associated protein Cas2
MPLRRLHLVAYDVRCPRRLRRVLHVVKAYATGGQKSVHECWLTNAERGELKARLAAEIDPAADSVLLVRPEAHAPVRTLGVAEPPRDAAFFYVG